MPQLCFQKLNKPMDTHIISYCEVKHNQLYLNNECMVESSSISTTNDDFLVGVYRHFGIDYPKFFKMDVLSKLAFIATEILMKATPQLQDANKQEVGIVFSNKDSSIVSDQIHQNSIQNKDEYYPSPAVFVYTLPNIMIGEVCIRHRFTGENALFVANSQTEAPTFEYASYLLDEGLSKLCICGWVNASNENLEANIYVVENKKS